MKNQWLMLMKNEDVSNLARDFPFILARELMVVAHRLVFAPRSLAAVPMTLRITRETLRKRRVVKRAQRMSPKALRGWLGDEGRAAVRGLDDQRFRDGEVALRIRGRRHLGGGDHDVAPHRRARAFFAAVAFPLPARPAPDLPAPLRAIALRGPRFAGRGARGASLAS